MAPAIGFIMKTECGDITAAFCPECAPVTCGHISNLINAKLFDGVKFYRSDFVIQFGLWSTSKKNTFPNLSINETSLHEIKGNTRGTFAVAHHDTPDNGNSEVFINLQNNSHLDRTYGGYCVFAEVIDSSDNTTTIDCIAKAIANDGKQPLIHEVLLVHH
jgi:cyclophilin family peptidyl-prolyl cis-trans isomerase